MSNLISIFVFLIILIILLIADVIEKALNRFGSLEMGAHFKLRAREGKDAKHEKGK